MDALEGRSQDGPSPPSRHKGDGPRVACPNCGRSMQAPPGHGTVGLGCKGCLHCYRYDYATGSMTPLGHIEPPPGHPLAKNKNSGRHWRPIAIGCALVTCACLGFLLYLLYFAPPPPEDAATRTTLEEIQRQLKSLTD